jgi:hypothetical protein
LTRVYGYVTIVTMPYKDREVRRKYLAAYMRARRAKQRIEIPTELSRRDRAQKLRQRFHKSAEWYAAQLEAQGGCCAICRKPVEDNAGFELSVDHDHTCCPERTSCGQCVRGLLCNRCNRALGLLSDSVEVLKAMIAYLESFKCHTTSSLSPTLG